MESQDIMHHLEQLYNIFKQISHNISKSQGNVIDIGPITNFRNWESQNQDQIKALQKEADVKTTTLLVSLVKELHKEAKNFQKAIEEDDEDGIQNSVAFTITLTDLKVQELLLNQIKCFVEKGSLIELEYLTKLVKEMSGCKSLHGRMNLIKKKELLPLLKGEGIVHIGSSGKDPKSQILVEAKNILLKFLNLDFKEVTEALKVLSIYNLEGEKLKALNEKLLLDCSESEADEDEEEMLTKQMPKKKLKREDGKFINLLGTNTNQEIKETGNQILREPLFIEIQFPQKGENENLEKEKKEASAAIIRGLVKQIDQEEIRKTLSKEIKEETLPNRIFIFPSSKKGRIGTILLCGAIGLSEALSDVARKEKSIFLISWVLFHEITHLKKDLYQRRRNQCETPKNFEKLQRVIETEYPIGLKIFGGSIQRLFEIAKVTTLRHKIMKASNLNQDWKNILNRIREYGIQRYYSERKECSLKDRSREDRRDIYFDCGNERKRMMGRLKGR